MNTGRKHIMNQIFSPFALALILGIIIVTSGIRDRCTTG